VQEVKSLSSTHTLLLVGCWIWGEGSRRWLRRMRLVGWGCVWSGSSTSNWKNGKLYRTAWFEISTGSTQHREYNWGATWKLLEIREYGRRNPSRWSRDTVHPQKLVLTSPTSVGRSVGIVRSRTKATELLVSIPYFERFLIYVLMLSSFTSSWSNISIDSPASHLGSLGFRP
jgi:hypothetical protein